MGCAKELLKLTLLLINMFPLLGGITFITIGALIASDKMNVIIAELNTDYDLINKQAHFGTKLKDMIFGDVMDEKKLSIGYLVAGSLITIISLFGCCGALFSSKKLLYPYAIALIIYTLLLVIVVIVYFVKKDEILESSIKFFKKNVEKYEKINQGGFNEFMVLFVQHRYKCCGFESKADFINKAPSDSYGSSPKEYKIRNSPLACCKLDDDYSINDENCQAVNVAPVNDTPCKDKLKEELGKVFKVLFIVLYIWIVLMIIIISITLYVARYKQEEQ